MRLVAILSMLAAFVACGTSPAAALDLESLLIQPGDLPAGMSGAQVRDEAPGMFDSMPKPDRAISQQLVQNEKQIGTVTALIYDSAELREKAYQMVLDGMGDETKSIDGLGEKAAGYGANMGGLFPAAEVLFARCRALIHIRMTGTMDLSLPEAYAKRLDKRLQGVVC